MTMTAAPTTDTRTSRPKRVPARVVTGTVLRARLDKGFSFASIDGEQDEVFLHNDYGRVVIGTPDQPKLTRTMTQVAVNDSSTDNPSRVVMLVVPGHKGLRAIAWGLIPTDDWSKCVFTTLSEYIGGEVINGRVSGKTFPGLEFSGILLMVTVNDGELKFTLGEVKQRNARGHYVPLSNPHMEFTYDLKSATADSSLTKDRFALRLPEESTERQLTFSLPTQK